MGRPISAAILAAVVMCSPGAARATCQASASGARSVQITLSPMSGILCLSDVRVFDGPSCGPHPPRWAITLSCNETRRMVVSDRGWLVALLSPRAHRRHWEIIRLFEPAGDAAIVRSVRFDELPDLPPALRRARLALDRSEVRVLVDPPVTVGLPVLETLGRVRARRRARP